MIFNNYKMEGQGVVTCGDEELNVKLLFHATPLGMKIGKSTIKGMAQFILPTTTGASDVLGTYIVRNMEMSPGAGLGMIGGIKIINENSDAGLKPNFVCSFQTVKGAAFSAGINFLEMVSAE